MIDSATFLPFALASAIVILVPGSDVFLLLRLSLNNGMRAGLLALAGIHLGNVIQAALMVSGIGLLISQFPTAIMMLKILGAAYLLYLALRSFIALLQTLRAEKAATGTTVPPAPSEVPRDSAPFTQGLLTNVTNPKVLLFFVAFFPQFLGQADSTAVQLLLLSTIFIALAVLWEAIIVVAAAKIGAAMKSRNFSTVMDAVCALAFTVLAVLVLLPSA